MDKCRKCMHEGKDTLKCTKCVNFVPFGDHFEEDTPDASVSDIY